MKTSLILILLAMVVSGMAACSGGDQSNDDSGKNVTSDKTEKPAEMMPATSTVAETEQNLEVCRAATKKLEGALKSALMSAMGKDGPVVALNVCHDEAEAIAKQICEEDGLEVGRTSQKFRNPSNAPDGWENAGLETFAARITAGENFQDMEMWATVINAEGGRTFRYLRAIRTGSLCLECHGDDPIPHIAEILADLYPEDHALGFSAGDMRGAYTVKLELPQPDSGS
ncbi:MAG: DUF3365 domain-containing protein [Candidatus Krumholzibacteria bacterium]|nr:DUF3365 domain-containing protein [Candidatus Krumholzibacteria bacterium]